jgi:hypothetical protein
MPVTKGKGANEVLHQQVIDQAIHLYQVMTIYKLSKLSGTLMK